VECSICNKGLAHASLPAHMLSQHGVVYLDNQPAPADEPAAEYRMNVPGHPISVDCPVDGCDGRATKRYNMRKHFMHRHPNDTPIILEEGNRPLPKCELCGMHVPYIALNSGHQRTATCKYGQGLRRQRDAELEVRRAKEVIFTACGSPLESVSSFRYLGRPLTSTDDDWPALHWNLGKARRRWGTVSRVLVRDGANHRCMAMFYKAVVQSVLLFGSETWVISDRMMKALRGFHHRAARRITGMMPHRVGGEWVYPATSDVLKKAGMYTIERYISIRRSKFVDYVATRPIGEVFNGVERLSGSPSNRRFWFGQEIVLDEQEVGGVGQEAADVE